MNYKLVGTSLVNGRGAGWRFSAVSAPAKIQPEPVDKEKNA